MTDNPAKELSSILGVGEEMLLGLDGRMKRVTGKDMVFEKAQEANREAIRGTLLKINSNHGGADHVRGILRQAIVRQEKELFGYMSKMPEGDIFKRAAALAAQVAHISRGYFLKKENIRNILMERPPQGLLDYLGYKNIPDLIEKEDLLECFSALRFIESNEWMHETFDRAYSRFSEKDFEERTVEIKVLGPKWQEVAKKFVAKKHHNVSHLKEFGVIFINPIMEDVPGKFLRDFALLLHYFHEIQFYSKLFQRYFQSDNFAEHFKSLLRGDVKEPSAEESKSDKATWLIVQRYLVKENPDDPRLLLPRVNPESIHWARGERDLANFAVQQGLSDLDLWGNLDWVGAFFQSDKGKELVSFDLEDNAMSLVSFMEGKEEFFTYHQREAMWTKIFSEYAGGEEAMEKLLIENFENGIVKF